MNNIILYGKYFNTYELLNCLLYGWDGIDGEFITYGREHLDSTMVIQIKQKYFESWNVSHLFKMYQESDKYEELVDEKEYGSFKMIIKNMIMDLLIKRKIIRIIYEGCEFGCDDYDKCKFDTCPEYMEEEFLDNFDGKFRMLYLMFTHEVDEWKRQGE